MTSFDLTVMVSSKQQSNCKKSTELLGLMQIKSIWTVHGKDVTLSLLQTSLWQLFWYYRYAWLQYKKTRTSQATAEARDGFFSSAGG